MLAGRRRISDHPSFTTILCLSELPTVSSPSSIILRPVFSSATSISHSSHWNQTWHSIFVEMNSILKLNSWCGQPRHPLTPISSALRKQPGTPPIHIDPAIEPTIVLPCTHVRPKYFSNGNFQFDSRTLPTHIAIN